MADCSAFIRLQTVTDSFSALAKLQEHEARDDHAQQNQGKNGFQVHALTPVLRFLREMTMIAASAADTASVNDELAAAISALETDSAPAEMPMEAPGI